MQPGERIAARFLLEAEAGRGGMGVVYRALDTLEGGTVALKLLGGDQAVDVARFEREGLLIARMRHPNVVRYVDHGATHDGELYLAMEWLEGETLAERIARAPLSPHEAAIAIRAAAAGLGAAHALGIVHRDVKPANLFLVSGAPDHLKVIDFGIARPIGRHELTLTTTGTVVGTPYYMAPEQARADTGVDARADLYSLGAVLYELLSGRPPFTHETLMALLAAILLEEPLDVAERAPEAPRSLAALTMRLLDKSPDARPRDGLALAERIDHLLDHLRDDSSDGLSDHRGGAAPLAPPALTEREQRVICLVLGRGRAAPLSHAPTLAAGSADSHDRMRALVEAQGGRLEVLADGSLVARVEGRAAPTEQAVRAARCAVAMRAIAPDLPLATVAGRGMFRGPIPVGEVIERGSALLERALAPSHEASAALPIRVDDVMAGLLTGRYEVTRDGPFAVLGAERRAPTTGRTLLGRATPFVGRRRELQTLEALYGECVEEPIARVTWITAPAGGGKSRLIGELLDRIASSGADAPAVWIARGDPIATGSPFGLLAQLVRSAAGVREGEPLEQRREKLLARIGGAIEGDEARSVAAHLGGIARTPFDDASAPDDPKLRGDAMRDAFLRWMSAELLRAPVVIVLDDLQWGDRPSVGFIATALRELRDRPLLVLAAARPEGEAYAELLEEHEAQHVRLARLTPRAAEELARSVLGEDADPTMIARVVERAEGNPFFLEELVRAVTEGPGELALPTTVLGMVEARLGVLEPSTRRVLRAASVFGRRFWRGGVVELLGGPARAGDVDAHLAVLVQRELVDRVSEPHLRDQIEHAFRSGITREAALAMLTDEDRALGHRLAGGWLEEAGERDALVLAEHFSRGGDGARAAVWLGRAAEQALEGDDLSAAIERAERALPESAERGPVLVTLADAHRWRGEYPQAFARAVEAAIALEPGHRPWFRALGVLFAAAGRVGRAEEAERWRAIAASAEAEPDAIGAQVVALCRAATLALGAGHRERFEATMERAAELARAVPDDALAEAWILTLRASWALREGDHGAFVDQTREAVRAYVAAGDARDACNQRVRLGNGYIGLGDVEGAEVELREALSAARRMSLPLIEGYALQNLGHALLLRGAIDEASRVEEQAIAIAITLGDAVLEAGSLLYLAEARERSGHPLDAVRDATRAVALLEAVPAFQAVARAVLARAVLASGDAAGALVHAEEAMTALSAHALEEGEALVQLVHAEALLANGRRDEARACAARAAERLEERARKITDLEWRDELLRCVPTHARLLELARSRIERGDPMGE